MSLEPIAQSEVSQKEKDKYSILVHISRRMVWPILHAGQYGRHRDKEQTLGLSGRRGWDDLRE